MISIHYALSKDCKICGQITSSQKKNNLVFLLGNFNGRINNYQNRFLSIITKQINIIVLVYDYNNEL